VPEALEAPVNHDDAGIHAAAPFLFHDDSSPVLRWTAPWLDTAILSETYARP
jgi:hypothetical protein